MGATHEGPQGDPGPLPSGPDGGLPVSSAGRGVPRLRDGPLFRANPRGERAAPAEDEAVFLVTDTLIIFDNVRHTIKVVACAMTDEAPILGGLRRCRWPDRRDDGLIRAPRRERPPAAIPETFGPSSRTWPGDLQGVVRRTKDYIAQGDIIQAVLSQRFQRETAADPVDLYRALAT